MTSEGYWQPILLVVMDLIKKESEYNDIQYQL